MYTITIVFKSATSHEWELWAAAPISFFTFLIFEHVDHGTFSEHMPTGKWRLKSHIRNGIYSFAKSLYIPLSREWWAFLWKKISFGKCNCQKLSITNRFWVKYDNKYSLSANQHTHRVRCQMYYEVTSLKLNCCYCGANFFYYPKTTTKISLLSKCLKKRKQWKHFRNM